MDRMPTCSQCGAPLPGEGWEGLCPKCVVRVSLEVPGQKRDLALAHPTLRYFGDYELLEEIARGGMGVVYKARQMSLNRLVALKMILSGHLASASEVQRFRNEAEAVAQLDHPNIVPIYEVGEHEGHHYFSMKLVEGPNLASVAASRQSDPDRPEAEFNPSAALLRDAATLLAKVARAVHYAHQRGILHRDIKPTNILIDTRGEPQLTDFGLARLIEKDSGLTQSLAVLGSANYMSPEQARGHARQLTTAADVYGLGAVLYEMLTGRPPCYAETFVETLRKVVEEEPVPPGKLVRELSSKSQIANRKSQIDRDLETICLKCLNKDPRQRYGSAEALAADLEHWLAREPIVARPIGRPAKVWRWCQRNPVVSSLAGVSLVLLLALAIGSPIAAFRINHQRQRADDEAAHAKHAEQETREQLRQSYLDQARANRWSGRAGRRFDSLEVLRKAAEIRPGPELRNEAIACLALPDFRPLKAWDAPPDSIWHHSFDWDYQRYAVVQTNGIISVRRVSDDVELERVSAYVPPISEIHFSPDGRLLAVIHGKDLLVADIWDLVAHEPLLKVPATETPVKSWCRDIAFSSDSRFAAVPYGQATKPVTTRIRIFDLNTRREAAAWEMDGLSYGHWFSPADTNLLLITDSSPLVGLWDWPSQRLVRTFEHPDWVKGVAWHPDGRLLAAGCGDSMIYVWTLDRESPLKILRGHENSVVRLSFDDGEAGLLASAAWDGTFRLWDPMVETPLVTKPLGDIGHLAKRRLATRMADNCTLLEVANGQECRMLHSALEPQKGRLDCAFHPNGELLASAHTDGVRLWLVAAGKELSHLRIPGVYAVLFHPDGRSLMISTDDGVRQWPIEFRTSNTGLELCFGPPLELGEEGKMEDMAITPDGASLAVIEVRAAQKGGGRFIHVFDLQTRRELFQAKGPGRSWFVSLSPDKKFLAVSDFGTSQVWLWDLSGQKLLQKLPVASLGSQTVFSPDGQWLVTTDHVEQRVWQVGTWSLAASRRRIVTEGHGFAGFSANAKTLATSERNAIHLMEFPSLRELATLQCPSPLAVESLRFSPDGSRLAANTGDRLIELWDLRLVHQQLAAMKLDWDAPPIPRTTTNQFAGNVTVMILGGTQEAQKDFPASHIPARDPRCTPLQIDLFSSYNAELSNCWFNSKWRGNDLATLPEGFQQLDGIAFDIRGLIQLGGIHPALRPGYPRDVSGIKTGVHAQALHFLHAYGWTVEDGERVGEYVIHYHNGETATVPLVSAENIRQWWRRPQDSAAFKEGTTVAWRGANSWSRREGYDVAVYDFRWPNPHPELEITTIDLKSAMTVAAPFLIAITAE